MSKNTSISLGNYFEQFVHQQIVSGRYKNVSEVIRASLRLLEEEESKIMILKKAIKEGIDSGLEQNFNSEEHLKALKVGKESND